MDPIFISVGTFSLIERLDKILRTYHSSGIVGQASISDILEELSILMNVLVESKILLDEPVDQPVSLMMALKRCQQLGVQIEGHLDSFDQLASRIKLLKSRMPPGAELKKRMNPRDENDLRNTVTEFKSSILLLKDIGTELVRLPSE